MNSNIGASSDMVAKLHLFYRSSVLGRRDLGTELASSIRPIDDFNPSTAFKNRNVEILQAYLKFMGVRIKFMDKPYEIDIDYGQTRTFKLKDGTEFTGTKEEFKKFKRRRKVEKKYAKKHVYIGSKEEYNKIIDREVYLDELDKKYSIVVDIPGL